MTPENRCPRCEGSGDLHGGTFLETECPECRGTGTIECLDGPEGCRGRIEFRMALSPSGRAFPRCDRHWSERLDEQERINERYPTLPPADFDPAYAGERWDEE